LVGWLESRPLTPRADSCREIKEEEYTAWYGKYAEASNMIGSQRSNALAEVAELIEHDFEVLCFHSLL